MTRSTTAHNDARHECTHLDPDGHPRHEHGQRVMYVKDRCRCQSCSRANTEYEAKRHKAAVLHLPRHVEHSSVRDHIRYLHAAGVTTQSIATATGVTPMTIRTLTHENSRADGSRPRRVHERTARVILSLTLESVPPTRIDVTGSRRRLQALVAAGWCQTELAERLPINAFALYEMIHGQRGPWINMSLHHEICTLYDQLWNRPPPSPRKKAMALHVARRHGWVPPLAWDDESIDDPTARPHVDQIAIGSQGTRLLGGGVVNTDSLTDCILEWGMGVHESADRLGVSISAIEQGVRRHAPHLRQRLNRNTIAARNRQDLAS